MQFDKMIGQKVRLQRVRNGMTQKKLADRLEISFQQVQKYEAGINRMSAERLWHISQIFRVPMNHWVTGMDDAFARHPESGEAAASPAEDRRAVHLMHYFSKIGDEEIKTLLFTFTKVLAGRGVG